MSEFTPNRASTRTSHSHVRCYGPPGIGKTALAIKVANDRWETDKNTMVVYVNCKYIYSADDFAEKVLLYIYHYSLNNPISGMKRRLG